MMKIHRRHSVPSVSFSPHVPRPELDRNFSGIRMNYWTNELLGLGSEGLFLCPLKGYFCVQERVTSVSMEELFLFLFPVQGYFCVQERVLSVSNR